MSFSKRLLSSAPPPFVASKNFNVVTYTGNSGTQAITGVGFQPDFVWIKCRSTAHSHMVADSTRGATKYIMPNETTAELTRTDQIQSFDTDGFTLAGNGDVNGSGKTYVAWCWKGGGGATSSNTDGTITSTVQANQDSGFSIVKYTGASGGGSWGHGLTQEPEFIIFKRYTSSQNWFVFAKISGAWHYFEGLNTTGAATNYASNMSGSSTTMTLNNLAEFNTDSSSNYLAYCFYSVAGYSKFSTYTGNGSDNGPIVETGFEPAFIMIKRSSGTGNWQIWDNKRSTTNTRNKILFANDSAAEQTLAYVDFLSNGFQVVDASGATGGTNVNINGSTYIYMAFAADPDTEAPTLASSFNIETYTGTGSDPLVIDGLGFKPGLVWIKTRDQAREHILSDIVRGPDKEISSNDTSAEEARGVKSFDNDGFTLDNATFNYNNNGEDYVAWTWEADDNEPTIFGGPARAIYKFEDNANDVTGNNNASSTANVTYTSSGKFNKAAVFNGSTSKVILPNGSFQYNELTISVWVKPAGSGNRTILDTYGVESGSSKGYILRIDNSTGKARFVIYNGDCNNPYPDDTNCGNVTAVVSTSAIATNAYTHIVVTMKLGELKMYINGELDVSTITQSIGYKSSALIRIGFFEYSSGAEAFYNGEIDQLRIYDGVVSDIGVAALYAETASDNDNLTLGAPPKSTVSANANAGMSVVKWEGTGTQTQIPHGLSAVPEMIISKRLDSTNNWSVYHKDLSLSHSTYPNWLYLNLTNAEQASSSSANHPYYARPSATVIYQNTGTSETSNVDGGNYISYCFHSVSGYSKFGSYTGNGNNDRAITTGFKPDFILIKSTVGNDNWRLYDTRRGIEGGGYLEPNRTDADDTSNAPNLTMTSTGFTITSGGVTAGNNANGNLYIYWAVAKNVPSNTTLANSFKVVTYTGNGSTQSITGTGFTPDLVWIKQRSGTQDQMWYDNNRGAGNYISSNNTNAQGYANSTVTSFDTDGFSVGSSNSENQSGQTFVAWAWKAGNTWQSNLDGTIPSTINANTANGFSVVKWNGNGNAATVGHGLSSAPEMVITKRLTGTSPWYTYNAYLNGGTNPAHYFVNLNTTAAETSNGSSGGSLFNSTSPTSTIFNIGTSLSGSSDEYVAYCFHSVSGYSKIGSYTGSGSDGNAVTTGFQPDFLMVKRANSTGGWLIFDSVRSGSNPINDRIEANNNQAEQTNSGSKYVDFNSNNFEANGSDSELNASSATYIYMAFKMN